LASQNHGQGEASLSYLAWRVAARHPKGEISGPREQKQQVEEQSSWAHLFSYLNGWTSAARGLPNSP